MEGTDHIRAPLKSGMTQLMTVHHVSIRIPVENADVIVSSTCLRTKRNVRSNK